MGCPEPSCAPRSPDTLHPTSRRDLHPFPRTSGLWHLPLTGTDPRASQPPARSQYPLARGLGNKGLKKSDNFSPQLDLIFFFDAPTAGGRIAAEEQVRQEKCEFGGARQPRASRERALALPGAGKWGLFCTDRKANDYA